MATPMARQRPGEGPGGRFVKRHRERLRFSPISLAVAVACWCLAAPPLGAGQQAAPDPALREAASRLAAGEPDAAAAAIGRFLDGREDDPAARQRAGVVWLLGGRPADALPHFERAVAADPGFVDARLALGQALAQLDRTDEALVHLDRAADLAPERYEPVYLAAAALDAAGRVSEAVGRAREAARRVGPDPRGRRFPRRLLLRIEAWVGAEAELRAALELGYRESPEILADLGAAFAGQEKLAEARSAYEQHLALVPDDPDTLLQLGYLDWRAGDHAASADRLNRAIELAPGLRRAHLFLGLTALRRLDLGAAEAAFRRALDQGEDFPEAWFHLGKIALRRGDAADAETMLETAVGHAPDYADAWYQLSFARRRLGDAAGAEEALARFEALKAEEAGEPASTRHPAPAG